MSIKRDLKREGIEIFSKIDTLNTNLIAKNVSKALEATFPDLNLNAEKLFMNISRLELYFAKLPAGISAKYYYKNKAIYIDANLEGEDITSIIIHECIHYIQERLDRSGNIVRLGLCDYTSDKLPGTGLNEAAVQLMASKCVGAETQSVRYFDINIQTNTEDYYPLECALVSQMAYVIGENVLFESTINANNNFRDQFISYTSEKAFYTIQKNIDLLVEAQNKLTKSYDMLKEFATEDKFVMKCTKDIEFQKNEIRRLFFETQEIILTSYFDNAINLAYTPKMIENYRNKLYLFKNLVGESYQYNFYNEYYINKMQQLEEKYEKGSTEIRDLVVVKHNFIWILFRKLRALFGLSLEYAGIKERE